MKIKELRESHRLTQKEFGLKVGETSETISNWERNVSKPSMEKLVRIAKEFKVSLEYLTDNVAIGSFPPVQDFSHPKECQECKVKDMEIALLREQVEMLKKTIALMEKYSP